MRRFGHSRHSWTREELQVIHIQEKQYQVSTFSTFSNPRTFSETFRDMALERQVRAKVRYQQSKVKIENTCCCWVEFWIKISIFISKHFSLLESGIQTKRGKLKNGLNPSWAKSFPQFPMKTLSTTASSSVKSWTSWCLVPSQRSTELVGNSRWWKTLTSKYLLM